MRTVRRWRHFLVVLAAALTLAVLSGVPAHAAGPPRVDLKVLVVSNGMPWVEAVVQQLASEGVPHTIVRINVDGRPEITPQFLAETLPDGTAHAFYQGVVLPDEGSGLSGPERTALTDFEKAFSVREVNSYVYPTPTVGTNVPTYAGKLDGSTVTVTAGAKAAGFGYLNGTFKMEDADPNLIEAYGFLAQPLPDDPATGAKFTSYLTAPIPGTSTTGTVAGMYSNGGREQLEISFGYIASQLQFRFLAHGVVSWVTKGVHLGYWRNNFSVHIDDIFAADSRWSDVGKCTPGHDPCPPGTPNTKEIRMVPNDAGFAAQWQNSNKFKLDMLYNGLGSDDYIAEHNSLWDPLLLQFQLQGSQQFRWVNHTYSHAFLGCVQDFTVVPWRCQTDAAGNIVWTSLATINDEINRNYTWGKNKGLNVVKNELVAGEHSGTKILPQQPVDNPNFVTAMGQTGVKWLGLDASREFAQRPVGTALSLPRHPINVFYNVARKSEETSEYNWIYTSRANGGSGICEDNPATTTCITPLNLSTGWDSHILPQQVRITLGYVLANDPQPFYMHQSNLTEDRLAYPVMSGVLAAYRSVFTTATPVVNDRISALGDTMQSQRIWAQTLAGGAVSGYVQGNTVTVTGPSGTKVPLTMPNGTRTGTATGAVFGAAYGPERSDYATLGAAPQVLVLSSTPYPGSGI